MAKSSSCNSISTLFFPVERNERETDERAGSEIHKMDPFIYILKLSTAELCQEHKTGDESNSLNNCDTVASCI